MLYALPNDKQYECPKCGRTTHWLSAKGPGRLHLHRIWATSRPDFLWDRAVPLPWYLRPLAKKMD